MPYDASDTAASATPTSTQLVDFLNELNTQVRIVDGQQVTDLVHSSVDDWPADVPALVTRD
jgi:hypothetical protein